VLFVPDNGLSHVVGDYLDSSTTGSPGEEGPCGVETKDLVLSPGALSVLKRNNFQIYFKFLCAVCNVSIYSTDPPT